MMAVTEVSIIVPCLNEADNIFPFVEAIKNIFCDVKWEIIFVDDNSSDGTIHNIRQISQEDPRVRGILRLNRKGLSSAVIEGALSVSSPYIAVMDGDLQHDEACLPSMLNLLRAHKADLVVASRYIDGGGNEGLSSAWRRGLSKTGIKLAIKLSHAPITDPMSGFFMIKQEIFDEIVPSLSGKGFKILLDLILSSKNPLSIAEVPMIFRKRIYGESKLGIPVLLSFAMMLTKAAIKR
ncbi:polyprenol monophosphomannose synthase [Aristophania vespae]|nr:polyprenol monophosphomannose synthase [Aristophania vespae]